MQKCNKYTKSQSRFHDAFPIIGAHEMVSRLQIEQRRARPQLYSLTYLPQQLVPQSGHPNSKDLGNFWETNTQKRP